MKKILIGTHNQGKFKEIAQLISKKFVKNFTKSLKIPSPKETGKFLGLLNLNSKLLGEFGQISYFLFQRFVNYPVISDDSGLCIN